MPDSTTTKPYKIIPGRVKHTYLTENEWVLKDPVLLQGEIAVSYFANNVTKFKVGNGTNLWSELPYTDSAIQAIIDDLKDKSDALTAKNVLELKDTYLSTITEIPGSNITFGTSNLAEVMGENWFPIIADDSQFATDIGIGAAAEPVFTEHFPVFKDTLTDNTYATMRDRVTTALGDINSGAIYIVKTDTNVSALYTLLKTDITISYNDVDYTIPVVKYQVISAMTEEEKKNLSDNLTDVIDKITAAEERLDALEAINNMNIVGYDSNNEVVNEEWQFTSSDRTTMRTVKPYVTGIPVISTITDTTDSTNISDADKALLAKYIDPEIATSSDTAWIDTVIGEYRDYITNNSTDGVFNKDSNVGDTYIDLPTTTDPDYSMATLVAYEEDGATVYKWVYHKSEHDAIDALDNKITQAETEIETIKDTFATKEEVQNKIKDIGNVMKIVGVVDTTDEIPGFGQTLSYNQIKNDETCSGLDIGHVYVVGDDTVDNKSEYVLISEDPSINSTVYKNAIEYGEYGEETFGDGGIGEGFLSVVYNDEVYIMLGRDIHGTSIAKFDETTNKFTKICSCPSNLTDMHDNWYKDYDESFENRHMVHYLKRCANVFTYDGKIHIIGYTSNNTPFHYTFDGTTFEESFALPESTQGTYDVKFIHYHREVDNVEELYLLGSSFNGGILRYDKDNDTWIDNAFYAMSGEPDFVTSEEFIELLTPTDNKYILVRDNYKNNYNTSLLVQYKDADTSEYHYNFYDTACVPIADDRRLSIIKHYFGAERTFQLDSFLKENYTELYETYFKGKRILDFILQGNNSNNISYIMVEKNAVANDKTGNSESLLIAIDLEDCAKYAVYDNINLLNYTSMLPRIKEDDYFVYIFESVTREVDMMYYGPMLMHKIQKKFDNVCTWEYLGKVTDVDLQNYYTKDAIDNLLNSSITDLGTVLNYKGSVKAITDLPVLTDCDFVSGYTITNDDQFDANKTTLEGLLETSDIKIGDVYFVGTNFANTVGYVFRSFTNDTGDITYVWQPLGKIYDADINNLKTRLDNLELLKVLNINNIVSTIAEVPGGVTNTMYYSADTVNAPDPAVYEKIAEVTLSDGTVTAPTWSRTESAIVTNVGNLKCTSYNDSLYVLVGHTTSSGVDLYKYDDTAKTLTNVVTNIDLSYLTNAKPLVYDNNLCFVKFDNSTHTVSYYKYNETESGEVTLPAIPMVGSDKFNGINFIEYNGELHAIGGSGALGWNHHYKLNKTNNIWETATTDADIKINATGNLKVFDNKIYAFSEAFGESGIIINCYTFDGTTWTKVSSIPESKIASVSSSFNTFVYDNNFYIYNNRKVYSSTGDPVEQFTGSIAYCPARTSAGVYYIDNDGFMNTLAEAPATADPAANFAAIIAYHENFKSTVLDKYDLGDIIYVAPDLNTTTLENVNLNAATPYMFLGYKVNLPMYPGADTTATAATDAEELYAYKWVQLPNAATTASVDKRLEVLEFNVESNTEKLTEHNTRIETLENAGYATITYVDEKVQNLGKLLNIKGILASTDLLPGYATNPDVMNGVTEDELAALVEATGLQFKVGDTYLVDNGDNTNKIEYTWAPITIQVPNPDYVDETTTPDSDPTLPVTKYKWEPLGSISGLDLESYYTKTLADNIFLRKDDTSVLRTTDSIIIDGSPDATGEPSGPSYSTVGNTPVNFIVADSLSNIESGDDLGTNLGKMAKWYEEIVDLRKEINKTIKPSSITYTIATTAWAANEAPETGYSAKMQLEGPPFMGNIGLCSDYTEEEYNAVTDSNLQVAGYDEDTMELIFTVDTVPTIDIRVEMVYIIDRSVTTTTTPVTPETLPEENTPEENTPEETA